MLQNFRFLCQKCCAVTAELRCCSLDSLDGFEEVFHFLSVRIPLDFLNPVDQPDILHLPQPLLYRALASEEDCFGGVSPKVHVRFVYLVLLCEVVIDVGVTVVKPVLVLMACASDEFEGRGMADVPQLTPSCLHGGIIIWSIQAFKFLGYLAQEGVGQQEAVFRTESQKEAIIVTVNETMGTQHSLSGSVVCPDASVEVAKDNQLIRLQHILQEGVQVVVKIVLCRIRAHP
ncbi:unnamed protein product [Schistocephalus solidus]|uniref:Secreted protein n=1 Tax=Schistocephalus solidus TaxID=70667 RepID=A0A183T5C8_SCHSO|nr:unnamed protein product [Schistocephalus solidus]